MSETPRTDAKERESEKCNPNTHAHYGWKFARQLERDLRECVGLQQKVYAWLGYWRDKLPPEAVTNLQDVLGPLAAAPTPKDET